MEVVTAYKCPKTGQLFESEAAYQTHQEELAKKAKKQREEAQREVKVETLAHVPRLHARNHREIAQLLGESLNKLRNLPKLRHIPKIVSVEIKGKYQERGTEWDLMSKVEPLKYPAVTPASGLEFRGRITLVSEDRPRNSDDFFSQIFHYMKKGSGGGGYDQDGTWKVSYDLLFNADDFPLIHAGLMHLNELDVKQQDRLDLIDQERQKREADSDELKELDTKAEGLRKQLAALRDILESVEAEQDAVQERIIDGVRADYPDTQESTRYELECEFPRDRRLRL